VNTQIQNLAMLSAVIAFAGCNSSKTSDRKLTPDIVLADTKSTDTPETKTIEGIVKNIFHGKDGYVASIHATDNLVYLAAISRSNLKNPSQFREFNLNEAVKLYGEHWRMNDEDQLTVREIR